MEKTKWFLYLRFYKTMGLTSRSSYFLPSKPPISIPVTIMILLGRKIRVRMLS